MSTTEVVVDDKESGAVAVAATLQQQQQQRQQQQQQQRTDTAPVAEIAASSVRSGLAELELKTSQVLQRLENIKTTNVNTTTTQATKSDNANNNDSNNSNDNRNGNHLGNMVLGPGGVTTTASASSPAKTQLPNEHKQPSDILKQLEELVSYSENEDDPEFPLPALDDVSHLALISHSIMAYLSHLDHQQFLRVTNSISGDTTRWLGTLFRFSNPSSSFHADNADAILRTVRLALVTRCPGYLEGGVPAMAHPCFYISESQTPLRLQYACRQLGISLDAMKIIPAKDKVGSMDLTVLERHIQSDLLANRTPLLVFADASASLCGFTDNLARMRDFCLQYNIWLHVSGHGLAALALAQSASMISNLVDSMSLNLGSWLGVPSLPIVLLHRPLPNTELSIFELDPILSRRLKSLSLWTTLQALGRKTVAERLYISFQTCDILYGIVAKCKGLRIISPAPAAQSSITIDEIINPKTPALDVDVLFDAAKAVVAFQFDGSGSDEKTTASGGGGNLSQSNEISLEKLHTATYFDRLNSWLGQILQRDCPNLDFEVVEHSTRGSCIRYCPLELGLGEQPASSEHLDCFAQSLEAHVDILRATIKHKAKFMHLVEKNELLRLVHLPEWAGMGGVRFVPEGWESLLTDQAKTELNKLNIDLVEALKSTDSAFSLGESSDGLICVRFGMVTHETEVEELLNLVVTVGKSVQENSRVLDTMSEIVKKGIEAATADLQRETEEKLWQEGILRHVPVVGRVFNWWSPAPKESGIKGRSLNLTQGVVESTENIYKYHMQMTGSVTHQLPANRSPPTPMVQTPVVPTANNNMPVFPIVEPLLSSSSSSSTAATTTTTTTTATTLNTTTSTSNVAATTTSTNKDVLALEATTTGGNGIANPTTPAVQTINTSVLGGSGSGGVGIVTSAAAAASTATAPIINGSVDNINHARTVSQSSTTSSSVPELVAVNNTINNN